MAHKLRLWLISRQWTASRGSASLVLLIICLLLVVIAQLALFLTGKELKQTIGELRGRQLQELCYSAIGAAEALEGDNRQGCLGEVALEPGSVKGTLMYDSRCSADGLVSWLQLQAKSDDGMVRTINHCTLNLPKELIWLEKHHQLIYKTEIEGSEYLIDTNIYASKEEVRVPQVELFRSIGLDPVNDERLFKNGFDSRFYYLQDKTSGRRFRFSAEKTFYGSTVFSCHGNIYIGAGCKFPGRVVFIARKGSIEIGRNVQLSNAVIMADRSVVINSGCRIKGVVYADIIRIKGQSEFLKDENFVAHFSSNRFIS